MDILRVAKFGGILTTVITVAADVLGYCSNFPDLYKGAIESSGLWAGILTGIFEKRVGNINNPYTYLAQIKSTFRIIQEPPNSLEGNRKLQSITILYTADLRNL